MARFCHVYLADAARAIDQAWTYAIPASLAEDVVCGSAVRVRFGRRKRPERAYVTHVFNDPPDDIDLRQIKPLEGLAAPRPVLTDEQIRLAFEMKRRWYCTMGDAIQIMVPPTVMKVGDRALKAARLVDREAALAWLDAGEGTTMKQVRVVELLLEHASAPCVEIQQAADVSASVLNTLAKRNVIEFFRLPVARPLPEEATSASPEPPPALTAPQQAAVEAIDRSSRGLAPPSLEEHLLFGVTGSGKTEVYLRAAERFLDRGRQVLILVPEIALTPQMTRRLTARFGDRVAILHSRLTPRRTLRDLATGASAGDADRRGCALGRVCSAGKHRHDRRRRGAGVKLQVRTTSALRCPGCRAHARHDARCRARAGVGDAASRELLPHKNREIVAVAVARPHRGCRIAGRRDRRHAP
jgi:primosomal protein N' (replication factor Y)